MRTINKYQLQLKDDQTVDIPRAAEVLHVDDQRGTITVWALIDTDHEPVKRRFKIRGTGHPINSSTAVFAHLGTVQENGFVWHVFGERP